jgi:two-component system, chemotaxis family, protein-glutamate methylesterase/glutaminase
LSSIFIYPGQLAATADPTIIKTILGSCVAVSFWDHKNGVGGLCHYLLPDAPGEQGKSGRYGEYAVRELYRQCIALGAAQESMEAQIYGGGAVVDSLSASHLGIGERNIDCARGILRELRVRVIKESVGGTSGRRIMLDTATGSVMEEITEKKLATDGSQEISRTGVSVVRPPNLTKVLIVDDSATIRNILKNVFDRSNKISVVGTAIDPYDAREKILALKPDVITLDIEMPRMNGIAFLEKLMAHHPMPVVVVSSLSSQGAAAERALELGAIEFVHKPSQFDPTILGDLADQLIPKVIAASTAQIKKSDQIATKPRAETKIKEVRRSSQPVSLIVVGGNGGAADALGKMIPLLATDTPPVVVAVSTIAGFADAWANKIQAGVKLPVQIKVIKEDTTLRQGCVYIASEQHVKVVAEHGLLKATLFGAGPVSGQRPSSDILFASAATAAPGTTIGVLLSGYGHDGINGARNIKESGGWTISQAPDDCAFNFTVVSALESGVIDESVDRGGISQLIYARRSAVA